MSQYDSSVKSLLGMREFQTWPLFDTNPDQNIKLEIQACTCAMVNPGLQFSSSRVR